MRRAKNVVVSIGGRPKFPGFLGHPVDLNNGRLIHSSSYLHSISRLLPSRVDPYRIAVIGGGQSSAEIFSDLQSRYPNSCTDLIIRDHALRPSDDSPFVNEIFNPETVDQIYNMNPNQRSETLLKDRATNYGVVRLDLIEKLYAELYQQKLPGHVQRHNILSSRSVESLNIRHDDEIVLTMLNGSSKQLEIREYDLVVFATGYSRVNVMELLESLHPYLKDGRYSVGRDYKLQLSDHVKAGMWLQGCCEETHGVSSA